MSNISRGLGTTITLGATNIGSLSKISSPSMKRETIDVTQLSTTGGFKQFIAGLADAGSFTLEGFFDSGDAGQSLLYSKFINSSIDTYTIIFPAIVGCTWTANCLIETLDIGATTEVGKVIDFKATLRISGAPNFGTTATAGLTGLSLNGTSGSLSPTFAAETTSYAYTFVTSTSITVTPNATTSQNYTIYVDGVNTGTFTTGSASPSINFAAAGTSHKIDIVVSSSGCSPIVYSIIAVRTS